MTSEANATTSYETKNPCLNVEGISVKIEDLFRAPEKDGAVVSVRVHRSVKEALARLAAKEGLHGVSELVRYLIAGFLMGKYKLEKPSPKVIAPPIYLNVNVQIHRGAEKERSPQDLELMNVKSEIEEVMREARDFLDKVKRKEVRTSGNDYARKLRAKVFRALIKAVKYALDEETQELKTLFSELNKIIIGSSED